MCTGLNRIATSARSDQFGTGEGLESLLSFKDFQEYSPGTNKHTNMYTSGVYIHKKRVVIFL